MKKIYKIGAHRYTVRVLDDPFENNADLGQCDPIKQNITILSGLNATQEFSTLLHEAIHAMNATLAHDLHDSLSEQIAQFLLDNNLIRYGDIGKITTNY